MKYITLICGLFFYISCDAQLTDSLWLHFEDGIGNKDSVLYGGVYEGMQIPERYTQSDFNAFDDIFEVGIAHFFPNNGIEPNEASFVKYQIEEWKTNTPRWSSWNQLFIRIKHLPLKLYYDRTFFEAFESRGAFITPDLRIELISPDAYGDIHRFECLANHDSLEFYLGSDYMALDGLPIFMDVNLINGNVDTVWGLRHSDLYWRANELGTPCPFTVSTTDMLDRYSIIIIQDGNNIIINNNGNIDIEQINLHTVSGKIVSVFLGNIKSGFSESYQIENHHSGFFIFQLKMANGEILNHKTIVH